MSNKRRQRIQKLQAELGCSYRTACNEYERRKRAHEESRKLGAAFMEAQKTETLANATRELAEATPEPAPPSDDEFARIMSAAFANDAKGAS